MQLYWLDPDELEIICQMCKHIKGEDKFVMCAHCGAYTCKSCASERETCWNCGCKYYVEEIDATVHSVEPDVPISGYMVGD